MIIFINDRPIYIINEKKAQQKAGTFDFDAIIDTRLDSLKATHLEGHIMLLNVIPGTITKLLDYLKKKHFVDLQSVTVVSNDKEAIENRILSTFTVLKAAGGIVEKNGKYLLMLRRGVWDLPKGKLDGDEKSRTAALREVEEETGVKASIEDKVCTTWHTYKHGDAHILKRTKWYAMTCVDDQNMKPQQEEDIEELEWLSEHEMNQVLQNSYSSIRFVVHSFLEEKLLKSKSAT